MTFPGHPVAHLTRCRSCSARILARTLALNASHHQSYTMNVACPIMGVMPKTSKQRDDTPDCGDTAKYTFSRLFLIPCVSQRTRNKVFLPRKPHAERWSPQPSLVELALLRTGPKGQYRPMCLERSEEVCVVEGLEAQARACFGGSGNKSVQIAIKRNQYRRGTRGKMTAKIEGPFSDWERRGS